MVAAFAAAAAGVLRGRGHERAVERGAQVSQRRCARVVGQSAAAAMRMGAECGGDACKEERIAALAWWERRGSVTARDARKALLRAVAALGVSAVLLFDNTATNIASLPNALLLRGGPALAAKGDGGVTFAGASTQVNKDPESLLRWALPITNKPLRDAQKALEQVAYDLRRLQWSKADDSVRRAESIFKNRTKEILGKFSSSKKAQADAMIDEIREAFQDFREPLATKNNEEVVRLQRALLRKVGALEELQIDEFPFKVPAEYDNLPQLKGRAIVELTLRKAGDAQFDIEGVLYDEGHMVLVLDGYSAPVTAGNIADLVERGFYNNVDIIRSDGFVIQTGDPDGNEGPLQGFVDPATDKLRTIPLEVFARGDKAPLYGLTLEDDGRGAAQTVLPFSSYGTLAMAREEFTPDSASSQWFFFLFEPDLTPAGRNLLDGRYAVFGYTIEGEFFLKDLKEGDRIVSAKIVSGLDKLQKPASASTK
mmetsp:Transcript_12220/g.32927  ORF Transcript_12220/g.32927 Transcript_12220/m.32927 type:complete len:482 (+) Transcript_12220:100-1545(+)|eukprot:CAMPEP_0185830322 /NCGR_PEP_ID=MMETSP1353-20130828/767_1 /TAXON_ID=1077150 /ORGANISM="Erythrolobus australicus, Strain CCMP3124" /LENGTH=481 /DNA_ID=CAMNT_0028528207 /DNA_START=71 /DNA_END=1516 /DNA_ORIENTATION=+